MKKRAFESEKNWYDYSHGCVQDMQVVKIQEVVRFMGQVTKSKFEKKVNQEI